MTGVMKSDGSRETFDAGKIRQSIAAAAKDSGIAQDRAKEVVDKVSDMAIGMAEREDYIEAGMLREMILRELDSAQPAVSKAWRDYDRVKGK